MGNKKKSEPIQENESIDYKRLYEIQSEINSQLQDKLFKCQKSIKWLTKLLNTMNFRSIK